ncbi:MAG: 50S ribosomal protein L3 [Desulfatibacillaceae bacterium]
MSRGLLGKKLGMTSLFSPTGEHLPVTVLEVGPCVVTQIKTVATDGYNAVQVGFLLKKSKRVNKPTAGHMQKSGGRAFQFLREFRVDDPDNYELGQSLTVEMFNVGERVDICGMTKGRGFSGVIKRHGFHGGKATHGCTTHRGAGSIGCSAWPSRVTKGKRMAGHYGNERQTVRNMQIVDIRPELNAILVRGAVPGARSGVVEIKKPKIV